MRDVITLFEQELTRHTGYTMMSESSGFVGMMERDLESLYDLLLATPENIDSESNFKGSCRSLRECNMLHLSEDGIALAEYIGDDAYLIPRTLGEWAEDD